MPTTCQTITHLHIINLPFSDTITIFEMNFRFGQRGQISHPSSISKQMAQAEVEPDLKHEGFPFYFTRYCLSLPQCYPLPARKHRNSSRRARLLFPIQRVANVSEIQLQFYPICGPAIRTNDKLWQVIRVLESSCFKTLHLLKSHRGCV